MRHIYLNELDQMMEKIKARGETLYFQRYMDDTVMIGNDKEKLQSLKYALRDIAKPIGVSEYELTRSLPDNLKGSLPSIEELDLELSSDI